jgi:hypothetical protein
MIADTTTFTGKAAYSIPPYSLPVPEVNQYRRGQGAAADLIVGCRRVSQRVSDVGERIAGLLAA